MCWKCKCRITVILLFVAVVAAYAQTPVEALISKYEDVQGARNFIASGARMALARGLLKKTQVAPIASDVDELAVLKMADAPEHSRDMFASDLKAALKEYDFYGRQETKNGEVDIYILRSTGDYVKELVIYNPSILSLNSLYGTFTEKQLLQLDKSVK